MAMDKLQTGDHFWGKVIGHGDIAVFMKDINNEFYACGSWECPFRESDIEFISKIDLPNGYNKSNLYYL